ncbi:winged helix-turn-helix transcriptional regulator [Streptomyces sp. NBC_00199]|uniref:winged helix-turn-helix transcriptional regulator n=1 Tax=Streptomyces sp. NBC_00199 TaxID=2975678 RepID=UPI002B1D46B9|nr:winged helix-turn-helix transcriptional regulator [Streptomyces sp. NBC_00199]
MISPFPLASDGVLTRRLREMTALGLVARTAHADMPPRTRYTLSSRGSNRTGGRTDRRIRR